MAAQVKWTPGSNNTDRNFRILRRVKRVSLLIKAKGNSNLLLPVDVLNFLSCPSKMF